MEHIEVSPRGRVLKLVRGLIDNGRLREGDLIPSGREIAHKLGVSRGVVKLALDELLRGGLIEETDGRSLAVARKPRNGSLASGAMVVLTPAPTPSADHQSPGWIEYIAQGAIQAVRSMGRNVMIMDPTRIEPAQVEMLLADRPGGVIFPEIPDSDDMPLETLDRLRDANIPIVVYGGAPELARFDRARSDHAAGAYALTKLLIARGAKRIACYWQDNTIQAYWVKGRRAGYERAMREAGLEPLPAISHAGHTIRINEAMPVREALEIRSRLHAGYLLSVYNRPDAPDALMLLTDGNVAEVSMALKLIGQTPGRDVLLVGYDNYWNETPERAVEPIPPLATVDKRNRTAGEAMVRLLMDRIEGKLPEVPQERLIEPELIEFGPRA